MMKTSIIICAYNEEKTISDVVSSCCKYNPDAEIIVVDDGSVDNTGNLLIDLMEDYNFKYEKLKTNMGKSWAMVYGVEVTKGDIIIFFDADVSNIREVHFGKLLNPIFMDEAEMVLGQPSETLIDYRINPFKPLTGVRALLRKDIIPILNDIKIVRFGIETYINLYYQAQGKRIKYVLLEELSHPTKYQKTSPGKATREFIKEGSEIALTLINNHELITKRIKFQFEKANKDVMKKISELQVEINLKLQNLKDKIDKKNG